MLQITSLFTPLKAEGWHITVNTTPGGYDVLKSDPLVDDFILQNRNQVPNLELGQYWERMAQEFDKSINLSGAVEGQLLAVGERIEVINGKEGLVPPKEEWYWSHEKRHALMNRNYVENIHRMAGVPFEKPEIRFVASSMEKYWARKTRRQMLKSGHVNKLVMWVLSGSSLHKAYPWTDVVIAGTLLKNKDIGFVLVGDDMCRILQAGWQDAKQVFAKAGEWSVRRTLTFAKHAADVVVGPETGVLNCVSMDEHIEKVVLMSHSSVENLTRDWANTHSVKPTVKDVPCHPCHQMHYTKCPNTDNVTSCAMCATMISPLEIQGHITGERLSGHVHLS